jgi:hypothetical protein
MWLKSSPILALVCLLPFSNFDGAQSVPPSAGGQGIQAALDSLAAGGEVVLSAGKYLIREPIMLSKDGQTLRGCGDSTVLYLADGADCPVVIMGSISTQSKNHIKGVRLADLLIDGNRKNQQKELWRFLPSGAGLYNNGVCVWGADESSVENVVCSHCRSGGLVASAQTRRLTVRDYEAFDNQFDGLACYDTEESHFSHLNLHDNLAAGVSLDLSFNHNVIHDAVLTDNDLGIFMRQSRDNIFEGVTIKQSRHHGVFMAEIGRYKLREKIGEGGCGVVYVAEQEEPVRRKGRPEGHQAGHGHQEGRARFEAERQALALMDHPNIAKVLDAGATETGRPYFVMELVRGVKITEYCDQNQLSTRERLDLVHQSLPGRPARAPERDHPPRPQALEHPGHRQRRRAGAQGD